MVKQRHKTHFFSYVFTLITLVFIVLVLTPYMPLEEGSFFGAVLPEIYSILVRYAGVFRSGIFSTLTPYTLVPAMLCLILFTADSIFSIEFHRRFFHLLFFAGVFFFCEAAQSTQYAFISAGRVYFFYGGAALAAVSFLLSLIFQIREIVSVYGGRKEPVEEILMPETEVREPYISEEERRIMNMTDEEALKILESLTVPEFDKYDNYIPERALFSGRDGNANFYSMAHEISDLQREGKAKRDSYEELKRNREQARRDRLSKIFQPRFIKEDEEEDDIFSDSIKADSEPQVDIRIDNQTPQFAPQQQAQVIYVQTPQPQVIYVQTENGGTKISMPSAPVQPVVPVQPQIEPQSVPQVDVKPVEVKEEPKVEEKKESISDKIEGLYKSESFKVEDFEVEAAEEVIEEPEEPDVEVEPEMAVNPEELVSVMGLKKAEGKDYYYDPKKISYRFPPESLLIHYEQADEDTNMEDVEGDGRIIVDTLRQFKIETQLLDVKHGPTFTLYELALARGIKVNTIPSYAENIAMDLAVKSVRILAPIPGKAAVGVEVPNKKRYTIGFDEMLKALKAKYFKVPMVLGKTITNDSIVIDLASAPHLLIAGTTGSGKSVCVNSLICSILYTKTPREVRMLLVDPKMVELTVYNDVPHLLTPVITEPKKAIKAMAYCVSEMQRRMTIFSKLGARKIEDYNKKVEERGLPSAKMPYIVVIVDEFADLMQVVGKELEQYIKRITAVARFTGIHLVLATQRPSADVITGIIKSNMPTQIAFAVANSTNSRIILDANGAEKLLGRGDMLYASSSSRVPQRIQGAYIDTEVEDIVAFVKKQEKPDYVDQSFFEDEEEEETENNGTLSSQDSGEDLFTRAWRLVAEKGEASASYLQRRLSIGYNRAANLIEQLEDAGYIGPARGGSKPREVIKYPDSQE